MKLVLKTISGKQHEVEVEPSATILDVKKLVEEEYEPASLRLCYNGKVMEDDQTVADAGLKEGESIVLAGRKRKIPKPPAQAPVAPPTPASTAAPASPAPAQVGAGAKPSSLVDISAPAEATAAAAITATGSTDAPVPPSPFLASAAPAATTSATLSAQAPAPPPPASDPHGAPANLIDEVCSMGFEDRTQVALALRAAYMNVDRAVEYLFDGIPPHRIQELTRDNAPAAPATASAPSSPSTAPTATISTTAAPAASTPESELRAALAGIPQFDQIRALYAQNTDTLSVVTQQIALHHPAVYELIERNPEAFLAIMDESGNPGSSGGGAPSQSAAAPSTAHGAAAGGEGSEGIMNQLPEELELTAEDRVAVQQLVELGGGMWDEQSALLVYLATQRNQEVAASILFEHGGVPPELLAEIANQMAGEGEDEYDDADEQQ